MSQTYFAILTAVGEAKDANAKALGTPFVISEMAVGDGNGEIPVPDRMRTTLVNQVRRAQLNQLSIDPLNANQVIAEQVIPENEGGWWIREIGLFDDDGDLIAIANCPPTYKPVLAEGSGRTQVIRIVLIMSSANTVQLKIDPSVVLATRKYADDAINASMNAHLADVDPHPQYMTAAETEAAVQQAAPAGQVGLFARRTAPEGWLKANGATGISRATYANLDAAIYCGDANNATALFGYRYTNTANPSGSRSINGQYIMIPDLRGEFMRVWDDGRGVDVGRQFGSAQTDENKSHAHLAGRNVLYVGTGPLDFTATGSEFDLATGNITTDPAGGVESRPRNVALLACIKY